MKMNFHASDSQYLITLKHNLPESTIHTFVPLF